eukprot:scaffold19295_cov112-Isochrysis_galbana.AAC.3
MLAGRQFSGTLRGARVPAATRARNSPLFCLPWQHVSKTSGAIVEAQEVGALSFGVADDVDNCGGAKPRFTNLVREQVDIAHIREHHDMSTLSQAPRDHADLV